MADNLPEDARNLFVLLRELDPDAAHCLSRAEPDAWGACAPDSGSDALPVFEALRGFGLGRSQWQELCAPETGLWGRSAPARNWRIPWNRTPWTVQGLRDGAAVFAGTLPLGWTGTWEVPAVLPEAWRVSLQAGAVRLDLGAGPERLVALTPVQGDRGRYLALGLLEQTRKVPGGGVRPGRGEMLPGTAYEQVFAEVFELDLNGPGWKRLGEGVWSQGYPLVPQEQGLRARRTGAGLQLGILFGRALGALEVAEGTVTSRVDALREGNTLRRWAPGPGLVSLAFASEGGTPRLFDGQWRELANPDGSVRSAAPLGPRSLLVTTRASSGAEELYVLRWEGGHRVTMKPCRPLEHAGLAQGSVESLPEGGILIWSSLLLLESGKQTLLSLPPGVIGQGRRFALEDASGQDLLLKSLADWRHTMRNKGPSRDRFYLFETNRGWVTKDWDAAEVPATHVLSCGLLWTVAQDGDGLQVTWEQVD